MKVIKFKDGRGQDRYGLKKRVWTHRGELYFAHLYYDFSDKEWCRIKSMAERRYMRDSAQEVLDRFDAIILAEKREAEKNRTYKGIVISDTVLRKQLEVNEDDEIQNSRHERWGVRD